MQLPTERNDITELIPSVKEIELDEFNLLKFWISNDAENIYPVAQHTITDIEILLQILDQCLSEIQYKKK